MRADHVGLRADAEEFRLHRVEVVAVVQRGGEDLVERLLQQLAGALAIHRHVLVAVGNPDVGHTRAAQGAADRFADSAAGDAVLDPKAPHRRVAMGQGETAGCQGMGEVGGVEVHADAQPAGPVDPALEVPRLDLVAVYRPAAGVQVDGVQVEAVLAGDEADRPPRRRRGVRRRCGPGRGNCPWPGCRRRRARRRARIRPRRRPASSASTGGYGSRRARPPRYPRPGRHNALWPAHKPVR